LNTFDLLTKEYKISYFIQIQTIAYGSITIMCKSVFRLMTICLSFTLAKDQPNATPSCSSFECLEDFYKRLFWQLHFGLLLLTAFIYHRFGIGFDPEWPLDKHARVNINL